MKKTFSISDFLPSIVWLILGLAIALVGYILNIEMILSARSEFFYGLMIVGGLLFIFGLIKLYGEDRKEKERQRHLDSLFKR